MHRALLVPALAVAVLAPAAVAAPAQAAVRPGRITAVQLRAVLARAAVNTDHVPVVLAGDLTSWQAAPGGDPAHDALVAAGYYDTADALTQVHVRETTFTDFATTLAPSASGWGARLDVIAVQGVRGAVRFENVFTRTDAHRASDHDMVVADLRLP